MTYDEIYMHRCLQLAERAIGRVAPNPMVGAVLVYQNRIIGEGWHEEYGVAHAEVNCLKNAIEDGCGELISRSTLYVSLEPCSHVGKTPPCTNLIISNKIAKVVVGCLDPFKEVNGSGIEELRANGIDVVTGVLKDRCMELNKRFICYHTLQRPYVILKWAQTATGTIGVIPASGHPLQSSSRLMISNEYTNTLVHKWRSEEAAILIGTNTALCDDPQLTNRHWPGPSPIRLVIDLELKLPPSLKLFKSGPPTIIFNKEKSEEAGHLSYCKLDDEGSILQQVLAVLFKLNIQSVLVEGGSRLLQSFFDEKLWDECRVITAADTDKQSSEINTSTQPVLAPQMTGMKIIEEYKITSDLIQRFSPAT